jgi:glycosyltransferase involved in cell wall biosynthesis
MNITILTQYYPPETGAPQNRLHSLALNLKEQGHYIQVLTAMPNYPKSEIFPDYLGKTFVEENIDGVLVYRTRIYVSKKPGVLPRLRNYFSFVYSSIANFKRLPKTELILIESPPLFLSWSAYYIARRWKANVVFNVSDLWPESAEKLNIVRNKLLLNLAYRLEAWSYKKATLVTGQTQGIVKNIESRFPKVICHWMPNGIDRFVFDSVTKESSKLEELGLANKKVFIYAGIIGHAQSLDTLIRAAALVKHMPDFAMLIIGDGPVKSDLVALNKELNAGVHFLPNTPKFEVLGMVASAYSYIVPLKDLEIFRGAIPSKIFDPLAMGIPVLLGVDGECRDIFIDRAGAGWYFKPEDEASLAKAIQTALDNTADVQEFGAKGKSFVDEFFDRKNIAAEFMAKLEPLLIK